MMEEKILPYRVCAHMWEQEVEESARTDQFSRRMNNTSVCFIKTILIWKWKGVGPESVPAYAGWGAGIPAWTGSPVHHRTQSHLETIESCSSAKCACFLQSHTQKRLVTSDCTHKCMLGTSIRVRVFPNFLNVHCGHVCVCTKVPNLHHVGVEKRG